MWLFGVNAANGDESAATAARATRQLIIEIGHVCPFPETYKRADLDILMGLCKLLALIDVPARWPSVLTPRGKLWLQQGDSSSISILITQQSGSRPC